MAKVFIQAAYRSSTRMQDLQPSQFSDVLMETLQL